MTVVMTRARRTAAFGIALCLLSVAMLEGCGISAALRDTNSKIESAINSFDNAIATLGQESADWRVVLADLQENIAKDAQSTIRTEVTNLTQGAILSAGGEFRCNAEFLRMRLQRDLIRIRNGLARDINDQMAKISDSKSEIPLLEEGALEPFICNAVPSAVDLALDPERREKIDIYGFDLRSRPISVTLMSFGTLVPKKRVNTMEFRSAILQVARPLSRDRIETENFILTQPSLRIKRDITNALSIISDFHAVLDLTESGVELEPNNQEIVISWNDKVQSEIAILAHQEIVKCKTVQVTVEEQKVGFFIPPAVSSNDCGGRPDKEFDGNGPCIRFSVSLGLDPERKTLTATYWMDAWECPNNLGKYRKDCSECEGSGSVLLYTAKDNERIISFDVQSSLYYEFIDYNIDNDFHNFSGVEPISVLEFIGDTDGEEAGLKTGVKMTFRRMKLQIERCEME